MGSPIWAEVLARFVVWNHWSLRSGHPVQRVLVVVDSWVWHHWLSLVDVHSFLDAYLCTSTRDFWSMPMQICTLDAALTVGKMGAVSK